MLVGERSSEAKGYKAERQEAGFGLSFMNQRESTGWGGGGGNDWGSALNQVSDHQLKTDIPATLRSGRNDTAPCSSETTQSKGRGGR